MKNFQEAIELILANAESSMTAEEIADIINEEEFFRVWKGSRISPELVLGRASHHNDIFDVVGHVISIKEKYLLKEEGLKRIKNLVSHRGFYKSEQVILFTIFWVRIKAYHTSNHWLSRVLPPTEVLLHFDILTLRNELIKLENELNQEISLKYDLSFDIFQSLELNEVIYVRDIVSSIEGIIEKMREDEFIDFFQTLVEYFNSQIQSQGFSVVNPTSLAHLNIQVDSKRLLTVFDPFCGSGLLVSRLFRPYKESVRLVLQDIDPKMLFISWMNLEVVGFENFSLRCSDYLDNPECGSFDFIVTDPPHWGPRLLLDRKERLEYQYQAKTWEQFLIRTFESQLNRNGMALLYLHESILTLESFTAVRKELIKKDLIQEIRQCDDEATLKKITYKSLVILAKSKTSESAGFVNYFLSKSQIDSMLLNGHEVIQNSNLHVENSSLLKKTAILNPRHVILDIELQKLTNGWRSIKELSLSIRSGAHTKRNSLVAKEFIVEDGAIPYVALKDLSNGDGLYLKESEVELHMINDETSILSKVINTPGILVSKLGGSLKPKIYDGSFPILLDGNVFCIEFNNNFLLPEFALVALNHKVVKMQVQLYSTGGGARRLNKKNLEQIKIPFSGLGEQDEEIKAFLLENLKNENRLTKESKESRKSTDDKETTILSSIKHELKAQILEPLATEFRLLKEFGNRKLTEPEKSVKDYRISENFRSRRFSEVIEHVDNIIDNANNLFENIQQIIDLNTSRVKLENVNILKLIKDCIEECGVESHGIKTVYSFESNNTHVSWKVDRLKLKNAFSNFIRNTLKHAFIEASVDKYLVFNVEHDLVQNALVVEMVDNGVGFVGGFEFSDLVEFGKQHKSDGTGIGGYLMKKAVEIHKGTIIDLSQEEGYISFPDLNGYPFTKFNEEVQRTKVKVGVHLKISIPLL